MRVLSTKFKKLIAINNGKIINISNRVLRKPITKVEQDKYLRDNSVCIVCNFIFGESEIKWSKKVKAICHPFRETSIFPTGIKKHLFSESDFCDKVLTHTKADNPKWNDKYDFVYFFLNSNQGTRSKGLHMIPMMDRVCGRMGLKGLIIGYQGSKSKKMKGTVYDKAYCKVVKEIELLKNIDVIYKKFDIKDVCSIMRGSKFVFFPNTADASPRLLTESLVRGVPVVVNRQISGGWKYVNDETGCFFDGLTPKDYINNNHVNESELSLEKSIRSVLSINRKNVNDRFYKEFGFAKSAKRLAGIINNISKTKYKAVAFEEWKKPLQKIGKKKGWLY